MLKVNIHNYSSAYREETVTVTTSPYLQLADALCYKPESYASIPNEAISFLKST
jgi:hypothetical protein